MPKRRGSKTKEGWLQKASHPFSVATKLQQELDDAGVYTIPDVLSFAASKYGDEPFMGTRTVLDRERIDVGGKKHEKLKLGSYGWRTYREVKEETDAVGRGLRSLGLESGDRIVMFAETRAEWFIASLGALQHNMTVVTLYTTLSDDGIAHGINETEASVVVTSYELLPRVIKLLPNTPQIKKIIVMEDQLEGLGAAEPSVPEGTQVLGFKDVRELGRSSSVDKMISPSPEDNAIIMYTSGSTGNPKGVEIMHLNIMASVFAYTVQMNVGVGDRYLAFLPLAHIMELVSEVALMLLGVTVAYSSPHTMTSTSTKVQRGSQGDAKLAKPTVMNAVPLVLDRIIKGVSQAVEKQGRVMSMIFHGALYCKLATMGLPLIGAAFDCIVFRKIQQELGGELKRMIVGGAPLSPQTHDTMRALFSCSIQVGYGSTETTSCISGMDEDDISVGQCGGPNLGVLIRLVDWEEGDYRTTDKPNPRGELVIGGPVVTKGYFKLPKENAESFFEENGMRWFRTGDIGEIAEDGTLRIIDRKKDLVKLKHGEYVSLGNVEAKLKTLPVIDNICIFARSTEEKTVGVVVPSPAQITKMASKLGMDSSEDLTSLCSNNKVREAVLKDIQAHGKKCGLLRWEIPAAIDLATDVWTPESGLVTAALKLRRKQLQDYYNNQVDTLYNQGG